MEQCCAACVIRIVRGRGIEVYSDGRIVAVGFGASECEEVARRRQDGLAFLHLIIITGCLSTHPSHCLQRINKISAKDRFDILSSSVTDGCLLDISESSHYFALWHYLSVLYSPLAVQMIHPYIAAVNQFPAYSPPPLSACEYPCNL